MAGAFLKDSFALINLGVAAVAVEHGEEERRKRKIQKGGTKERWSDTVKERERERDRERERRDERERMETREASLTKRSARLFAATNILFMESALEPLRERQKERKNER